MSLFVVFRTIQTVEIQFQNVYEGHLYLGILKKTKQNKKKTRSQADDGVFILFTLSL